MDGEGALVKPFALHPRADEELTDKKAVAMRRR
jgi:hypothetical protein